MGAVTWKRHSTKPKRCSATLDGVQAAVQKMIDHDD
jgi:hypothetical protein